MSNMGRVGGRIIRTNFFCAWPRPESLQRASRTNAIVEYPPRFLIARGHYSFVVRGRSAYTRQHNVSCLHWLPPDPHFGNWSSSWLRTASWRAVPACLRGVDPYAAQQCCVDEIVNHELLGCVTPFARVIVWRPASAEAFSPQRGAGHAVGSPSSNLLRYGFALRSHEG